MAKIDFETDGNFEVQFSVLPDDNGAELKIDNAELGIEIEAGNFTTRSV